MQNPAENNLFPAAWPFDLSHARHRTENQAPSEKLPWRGARGGDPQYMF